MMKENIILLMSAYFDLQKYIYYNFCEDAFEMIKIADHIKIILIDELNDPEMEKFNKEEQIFFKEMISKRKIPDTMKRNEIEKTR